MKCEVKHDWDMGMGHLWLCNVPQYHEAITLSHYITALHHNNPIFRNVHTISNNCSLSPKATKLQLNGLGIYDNGWGIFHLMVQAFMA